MVIERRGRFLPASLLATLGLGAWMGCRSAFVTLPADDGAFAFSPAGRSAVLTRGRRIALYDLDEKRMAWTRPIEESNVAVRFSPSGDYLAVFSSNALAAEGTLALLAATDGKEIFRHRSANVFALSPSDDGEWLARNDGLTSIAIEDRGGNVVHRQKIGGEQTDGLIRKVAFAPGGARLAIDAVIRSPARSSVTVLDRQGGKYLVAAAFEGGYWSSFAGGALFFGSASGVERWGGAKRSTVFANDSKRGEGDLYADDGNAPTWRLAPDGLHLAIWSHTRLAVVSTTTGAIAFSQSWTYKTDEPAVCDAAFAGPTLRAFLRDGDLLDIDLARGKVGKTRSFGAIGSSSRYWVWGNGSNWSRNYQWALAPTGRYLLITRVGTSGWPGYHERAGKHEIHLLE